MVPVMELLGIRIPKFTLKRRVCISRTPKTESGASSIKVGCNEYHNHHHSEYTYNICSDTFGVSYIYYPIRYIIF